MLSRLPSLPAAMSYRVICWTLAGLFAVNGWAAPFVPRADDEVLERLPSKPSDPTMREMNAMRRSLARDPRNLELAVKLARRYFEHAAAESDPRYIGYAQAALKPWWDASEPPQPVLVVRAAVRQYRHDFSGALADLGRALELDPRDTRAWSLQAAINV